MFFYCSNTSLQTHHVYSTLKRCGNDCFHVVSTWNTRGVFVGFWSIKLQNSLIIRVAHVDFSLKKNIEERQKPRLPFPFWHAQGIFTCCLFTSSIIIYSVEWCEQPIWSQQYIKINIWQIWFHVAASFYESNIIYSII